LALTQLAVLLATFMSPAYAAGAVADPLHHAHVHAGEADHHHPGDLPDPSQDEGLDPHQLIGHVLAHLPPVAAADPMALLPVLSDTPAQMPRSAPPGASSFETPFRPPRAL
jgi:hypothetical protein